jgi:citrate synthase
MVEIETELSKVDGAGGALTYRGRDVADVAGQGSLETVLAWLWEGRDPVGDEGLGEARAWVNAQRERLRPALELQDGMTSLQAAVALLPEPTPRQLVAAVGVCGAWWVSGRVDPVDPGARHADDLLRLAVGSHEPSAARAFGIYLGTVADHGTNASTFAARVVASTGAGDQGAVGAALAALAGPLHGGAPGPVLDMLDAVERPAAAADWVAAELRAGRRIMGMGHRVYRARDPRAALLEAAADELGADAGRRALARAVEAAATEQLGQRHPQRALRANVEFATAVLLEALGLPRRGLSVAFAMGRVVGWLAHTAEQRRRGRLIRPRSRYVGVPSVARIE